MPSSETKTRPIPVTADNFNRAESDMYFAGIVQTEGAFGKFNHHRELIPIDKQPVIRSNRDTLYSAGVFDLNAGPVTITLPDAGARFMSLQVIDEDQYTPAVFYGAGNYTLSKDRIGTRYVLVALRTLLDPNDPNDVAKVHDLQDAVKVDQPGPGTLRGVQLGSEQPEESTGCALGAWLHPHRYEENIWAARSSGFGEALDWDCHGLGRKS